MNKTSNELSNDFFRRWVEPTKKEDCCWVCGCLAMGDYRGVRNIICMDCKNIHDKEKRSGYEGYPIPEGVSKFDCYRFDSDFYYQRFLALRYQRGTISEGAWKRGMDEIMDIFRARAQSSAEDMQLQNEKKNSEESIVDKIKSYKP